MFINYKGHRIFAFSDTHGMHRKLSIPDGADILVCSGDGTSDFSKDNMVDFLEWYSSVPARLRIFISGNHEIIFNYYPQAARALVPDNIVYLEDDGFLCQDISFYCVSMKALQTGNVPRIPGDTDFLVTHFPPEGVLDDGRGSGLLKEIVTERRPRYHLFGHVHTQGGKRTESGGTTFCNVSCFMELRNMR